MSSLGWKVIDGFGRRPEAAAAAAAAAAALENQHRKRSKPKYLHLPSIIYLKAVLFGAVLYWLSNDWRCPSKLTSFRPPAPVKNVDQRPVAYNRFVHFSSCCCCCWKRPLERNAMYRIYSTWNEIEIGQTIVRKEQRSSGRSVEKRVGSNGEKKKRKEKKNWINIQLPFKVFSFWFWFSCRKRYGRTVQRGGHSWSSAAAPMNAEAARR